MAIPLYLAMTAAETATGPLPENMAYMACHFASYGQGLSNLPSRLPPGALLILNDRVPVWQHDPQTVARQLLAAVEALSCSAVLLDLQRPGVSQTKAIVSAVTDTLPCPVGVSQHYAQALSGPVFLSAPPPDTPPERHIAPWAGREIWLEAALETLQITVTVAGSTVTGLPYRIPSEPCHRDGEACCRYHMELFDDRAVFTVSRTAADLAPLFEKVEALGVTKAVGLYQQLNDKNPAD